MKQSDDNTAANSLPQGITLEGLKEAVHRSGYPLQLYVANLLRERKFEVQEEWSYRDQDSSVIRALDIYAERQSYDLKSPPRVRPTLSLLVECKQSELPHVFFLTRPPSWPPAYPMVTGLRSNGIAIDYAEGGSHYKCDIATFLGLSRVPFVASPPRHCATFSKVARKGKALELSGSEVFAGIVLPILKALDYFQETRRPPETWKFFDCYLALGVCVLDAPLVAVHAGSLEQERIEMVPWVRLFRHQEGSSLFNQQLRVIDIVHHSYFGAYLDEWVEPFDEEFSRRVGVSQEVLATTEGFEPEQESLTNEEFYSWIRAKATRNENRRPPRKRRPTQGLKRTPGGAA